MKPGGLKSRRQRRAGKNNDASETADATTRRRRSTTVRRHTRRTLGGRKPQRNPSCENTVEQKKLAVEAPLEVGDTQAMKNTIPQVMVSRLPNVYGKDPVPVSLEEIFNDQRDDETIKRIVEKIQITESPEEQSKVKKELPAYILAELKPIRDRSGKMSTGVSTRHFKSSRLLQFDIDKIDKSSVAGMLAKILEAIPEAFYAFISPSGRGVRFMVSLKDEITDPSIYSRLYKQKMVEYSEILGVELDSTSDATRKWYYTHVS